MLKLVLRLYEYFDQRSTKLRSKSIMFTKNDQHWMGNKPVTLAQCLFSCIVHANIGKSLQYLFAMPRLTAIIYKTIGIQGAAKKSSPLKFFAVFSATARNFNMEFYRLIYKNVLHLTAKWNMILLKNDEIIDLSLIHIWRCRRSYACRSRWSPSH